ncbi:MAG: acyl-CoA dehydrogenase family protein [Acidimicrobiales bacterium]
MSTATSEPAAATTPDYLDALAPIVEEIVGPWAAEIDAEGRYPTEALAALGSAGLLGLISAREVGGRGEGHRAATLVVEELARHCGSTAMVVLMHYAATAVIEAFGGEKVRTRIAAGNYVTTLAFSEASSRSMFWVPTSTATSTATLVGGGAEVRLDARKSWVTSAGQARGYVWSSKPLDAEGLSTLWLVPADAPGLTVGPPFDGLGLRGNESRPVTAEGVAVPKSALLGVDGAGFDVMMGVVLPYFQVMSAGFSVGTADSSVLKAASHVANTRYEHLDQSLAENLVTRSNVARARVKTDEAWALLLDTFAALESGREDAILRVLEVKASASETASEVTDLAMRVCGGAAFRKEVGVERHFRDARATTVMAPTTDALYDFIGRVICGLPLF